ncbi:MAG: endopeptidase La [Candidatus Cloacimonadia bacterium]
MKIKFGEKEINLADIMPLIPIRNVVIFPYEVIPLSVGRSRSVKATERAFETDKLFISIAQKSSDTQNPKPSDLYQVGTICRILQLLKMPDTSIRLLVEGIQRVKVVDIFEEEGMLKARYNLIEPETLPDTSGNRALMRNLEDLIKEYISLNKNIPEDMLINFNNIQNDEPKIDFIAAHTELDLVVKQKILEYPLQQRLPYLNKELAKEIGILRLRKKIATDVQSQLSKSQKEYLLSQELQAIQKELGIKEKENPEIKEIEKKLKKLPLTEEARKKAEYELNKLKQTNRMSPEYTVSLNYLNWIVEVPWENPPKGRKVSIKKAENILEQDHYGLKQVKERILEYLSVLEIVDKMKGQILCFVGPPGVGKTSLGQSIARALKREFTRLSLGGVRDEAEIRGHRKTYIGAMPGVIIQAMRRLGSKNPVIMLDEVDKMSMDFRGDPSAALLEVLDPEQNFEFHDHYLEIGYDLSQVLFITTANDLYAIPPALRDRMEVISLPGYTEFEKVMIAKKYLLPKQLANHGLTRLHITIEFIDTAFQEIVRHYTQEAGVRQLEREIASILRKIARHYLADKSKKHYKITQKNISTYLGVPKYSFAEVKKIDQAGIANGLAWTPAGGVPLQIEVAALIGKGNLILTGKLGDVMKESANAALTFARAHYQDYGIEENFYQKKDIHVHVPEGAIPKDGPSAGITIATAIISALSGRKVKSDYAMTGELTLTGNVLPIGGLAEKLVAAHRAQIENVIIPKRNANQLKEIPKELKKGLNIIPVETMNEVLNLTLEETKDKNKK